MSGFRCTYSFVNQSRLMTSVRNQWLGFKAGWMGILLVHAVGCGLGPASYQAITVDADAISQQVMTDYDKDQNGSLSAEELKRVPPLADSQSRFDTDRNGSVSVDELRKNLERVFDSKTSLLSPSCVVKRNGQPLVGAEVRFVPAAFLQDVLPVASGVSGSDGIALLSIPPEDLPDGAPTNAKGLMRPGLYVVEVTHKDIRIPEQYNRATTLGKEVSREAVVGGDLVVNIKM